jgi:hypothetical protein
MGSIVFLISFSSKRTRDFFILFKIMELFHLGVNMSICRGLRNLYEKRQGVCIED